MPILSGWFVGRQALGAALIALTLAAGGCAAPEQLVRRVDEQQASLSRGLADVVDGLDRAFGEPRVEDRERMVQVKLGARVAARENNDPAYTLPLSLRVPLPALERRFNVFLRFDSVKDLSPGADDSDADAGLDRTLSATVLSRVDQMETGVRLDLTWDDGLQTGFRPFLRSEWRPGRFRVAVEQQALYRTDKGFGGRTLLEVDRVFGDTSFVRLRTSVEGNEGTPGTTFEHVLIHRRPFAHGNVALSGELGISSNSYNGDPKSRTPGAENDPDQGFAQVRIIGTAFRPWIEYEIMPAVYRPWRHEDALEYGVTFTLRVVAEHPLEGVDRP